MRSENVQGNAVRAITVGGSVLAMSFGGMGTACAQQAKSPEPTMAPIEKYMAKSPADEIALARTAAPPSISADAEIMVLGAHGYETAVKGKNGFVCFVQRSWAAGFDFPGFWNPKISGPNCFNPPAARTELQQYLKRTEWVLAGATKEQLIEKTRAAVADHTFKAPEPGSFSFMLSKNGFIGPDASGPWLPHVMMFIPHGQAALWAAGVEGSPILGDEGSEIESTVLYIPVRQWSDGTAAPVPAEKHTHT
jgi:hypothetical protein